MSRDLHAGVGGCTDQPVDCHDERHLPAHPGTVGHRVEVRTGEAHQEYASHHDHPIASQPGHYVAHGLATFVPSER